MQDTPNYPYLTGAYEAAFDMLPSEMVRLGLVKKEDMNTVQKIINEKIKGCQAKAIEYANRNKSKVV
jgi:hypothetical protein